MKKLVIDADDFGTSKIFNHEIVLLCEQNKLTGISIMVKRGIENQAEDVKALKEACKGKNISL